MDAVLVMAVGGLLCDWKLCGLMLPALKAGDLFAGKSGVASELAGEGGSGGRVVMIIGRFSRLSSIALPLRFRRFVSLSDLSSVALAIRSNSQHTFFMRCTASFPSSWQSIVRKVTTTLISRKSDRARGSVGFCKMLPNKVTSAETGK